MYRNYGPEPAPRVTVAPCAVPSHVLASDNLAHAIRREIERVVLHIHKARSSAKVLGYLGGGGERYGASEHLVPFSNTERPECLTTGFVQLVAIERAAIVERALSILDSPPPPALPINDHAPFGGGDAATRIVRVLEKMLAERAFA